MAGGSFTEAVIHTRGERLPASTNDLISQRGSGGMDERRAGRKTRRQLNHEQFNLAAQAASPSPPPPLHPPPPPPLRTCKCASPPSWQPTIFPSGNRQSHSGASGSCSVLPGGGGGGEGGGRRGRGEKGGGGGWCLSPLYTSTESGNRKLHQKHLLINFLLFLCGNLPFRFWCDMVLMRRYVAEIRRYTFRNMFFSLCFVFAASFSELIMRRITAVTWWKQSIKATWRVTISGAKAKRTPVRFGTLQKRFSVLSHP